MTTWAKAMRRKRKKTKRIYYRIGKGPPLILTERRHPRPIAATESAISSISESRSPCPNGFQGSRVLQSVGSAANENLSIRKTFGAPLDSSFGGYPVSTWTLRNSPFHPRLKQLPFLYWKLERLVEPTYFFPCGNFLFSVQTHTRISRGF